MDYNDVPPFLRVVETLSFTRAAELLGTQKSAISRSIKRLETELGVRLLQRTTRRLALTDAGQAFYERARGALHGLDDAAAAVRELGTKPRGPIRMTAPNDASVFGLAEAVTTFLAQYPAVQVEVVLTERIVDLVAESFDLAVRAGELVDSSLVARRVGSSDAVPLASPAYLKRRGRPRKVADLAKHECVLFRARAGKLTWTLQGPSGEEKVEVSGQLSVNQPSFLLQACIAGAGIGLLLPGLASEAIRRGELEEVLPFHFAVGSPVHVVLPSAAFLPLRVALFRDHLVQHLTKVSADTRRQCAQHAASAVRSVSERQSQSVTVKR